MPTLSTEGIVLKRRDFGEADRILTILTDRFGKIQVMAKGVRRITSRRAGNIEVLNRVKLQLFKSKNYNLNEAEAIETFDRLKENLILSTTAFHIIELVDRLTVEEQKNPQLYDLVLSTLLVLERNPRQIIVRAFEIKLLSVLGFWSVAVVSDLDLEVKKLIEVLEYKSFREIEDIEMSKEQALVLERILRYYLEKVLESGLKSVKVLSQLKDSKI